MRDTPGGAEDGHRERNTTSVQKKRLRNVECSCHSSLVVLLRGHVDTAWKPRATAKAVDACFGSRRTQGSAFAWNENDASARFSPQTSSPAACSARIDEALSCRGGPSHSGAFARELATGGARVHRVTGKSNCMIPLRAPKSSLPSFFFVFDYLDYDAEIVCAYAL